MERITQHKCVYKTKAKGRKTHANEDFGLYKVLKCFLSTLRDRDFKQALKTSATLGLGIPSLPHLCAGEDSATFLTAGQR